jgi:integrase
MPRPTNRVPSLTLHKPTGQARVRLAGRDHYLGPFGSPEADERYRRLVAEFLTTGRPPAPDRPAGTPDPGLSVNELVLQYWRFAQGYYRKGGRPTTELALIRDTLRLLRSLYGTTPAADFTPARLETVRDDMIRRGWVRSSINRRVGRIKRAFRWGVAKGHVPATVLVGLNALDGLRKGRCEARESEPVRPVEPAAVNAILGHLTPQTRDMARLQALTGMRPGEVCLLRPCDVDRSGEAVWEFRPVEHMTEHHGRERIVFLGPRAQAVLGPWFENRPADAWCFSPAEARETWADSNYACRRERAGEGGPGTHRPRERYDVRSYGQAVKRACERAGVTPFSPNRLRHSAATAIRKGFGVEAAQVLLGHSDAVVTQVYAERDLALGRRVAAEIG